MRTKIRRLALLGMLIGALLGPGLMAPAQAAGTTQVDGSGYYDDITGDECDAPPSEFSDYPALVLHGDLEGCLYAHVLSRKFTPSGVWIETGQELVVASLNGGPVGTFTTNYRFARTTWTTRCSTTAGTSRSADEVAPFRHHDGTGQAATSPSPPRRQHTHMPRSVRSGFSRSVLQSLRLAHVCDHVELVPAASTICRTAEGVTPSSAAASATEAQYACGRG